MTVSRMLYIDDSGSVETGLVVYGWVECRPERWRDALRRILELRKSLYRNHMVPPSQELHATKFVNGRSRISTKEDQRGKTEWKTLGRLVALECLEVLAECEDLRIGAVYRRTSVTGTEYRNQRADVYRTFLESLNEQHRDKDTYALIGMDGNGSDRAYFNAHRSLPLDTRHIIEDPMLHDSKQSQMMQMADLVAYTVFCHLNRHPGNEFAWNWYEQYLAPCDCEGGPVAV